MALPQKSALPADLSLNGEKNGRRIGIKLSTAQRNAKANEADYLCAA
jgi:hypothetical protein